MKWVRVSFLGMLLSFLLFLSGYFALESVLALRQDDAREAFDNLFMSLPAGLLALFFAVRIVKEFRSDSDTALNRED